MQKIKRTKTFNTALAAITAAAYVVLTLPFGTVAVGPIQFRLAEALTLMPFVFPGTAAGLFAGCFISNLLFSTPLDAVIGSIATLIAAIITAKSKNVWVAATAPVAVNAIVIGPMLWFMMGSRAPEVLLFNIASIGLSQAVVCYAIGVPFAKFLKKRMVKE